MGAAGHSLGMDTNENPETHKNKPRHGRFDVSVGAQVEELTAEHTGRWLVTTQGSRHVWDLDEMTYMRLPTEASKSGAMPHDGRPVRIDRVVWWPKVGERSWLWFDDPQYPLFVEHYRINSVIKRIERLADDEISRDAEEES